LQREGTRFKPGSQQYSDTSPFSIPGQAAKNSSNMGGGEALRLYKQGIKSICPLLGKTALKLHNCSIKAKASLRKLFLSLKLIYSSKFESNFQQSIKFFGIFRFLGPLSTFSFFRSTDYYKIKRSLMHLRSRSRFESSVRGKVVSHFVDLRFHRLAISPTHHNLFSGNYRMQLWKGFGHEQTESNRMKPGLSFQI